MDEYVSELMQAGAAAVSAPGLSRPLVIGSVVVDSPLLMAPMAGFTTYAFRQIVRQLGGCGLPVTEMVSARGFREMDVRKRQMPERLWGVKEEPRPLSVQIWDNDPGLLAEMGHRLASEFGATVIDINFGCPAPDIAEKARSGAYLLQFPEQIGAIVSRVAAACASTPVTAKIRLGVSRERITAAEVAQAVEEGGAAGLTVHGRTAADFYRGQADWEQIAAVKTRLRRIPLIGNGDLQSAADVVRALRQYSIDGVMIGRAAVKNPWIFRQTQAILAGLPTPPPPRSADMRAVLYEHFRLTALQHGEPAAAVLMRKVACGYSHAQPKARAFRDQLGRVDSFAEFATAVDTFFGD